MPAASAAPADPGPLYGHRAARRLAAVGQEVRRWPATMDYRSARSTRCSPPQRRASPGRTPTASPRVYVPDYDTLRRVLAVAVDKGAVRQSGVFANGIDVWIAHELRRAGFSADEVWPRPTRPRILPRDLAVLLDNLPAKQREDLAPRIARMPAIAPTDANVLGRAYDKQVDVVIARWDRGPEVLISTKAQLSSFGKNLPNRFEESYGDAGNLRGRHPLAAVGYFFVQRATIIARRTRRV